MLCLHVLTEAQHAVLVRSIIECSSSALLSQLCCLICNSKSALCAGHPAFLGQRGPEQDAQEAHPLYRHHRRYSFSP